MPPTGLETGSSGSKAESFSTKLSGSNSEDCLIGGLYTARKRKNTQKNRIAFSNAGFLAQAARPAPNIHSSVHNPLIPTPHSPTTPPPPSTQVAAPHASMKKRRFEDMLSLTAALPRVSAMLDIALSAIRKVIGYSYPTILCSVNALSMLYQCSTNAL